LTGQSRFEELVRRTGEFLDSAPSMRPQPLISVTDVTQSSRWYQELLRCESGHGGDEYERLLRDGTLVLQLHRFDVGHHHGRIGDPSSRPYGNGVALWFEIDDFDDAVQRAEALHAQVVLPPHRNSPDGPGGPAHRELWLRDPDGYLSCLRARTASRRGRIRASADIRIADELRADRLCPRRDRRRRLVRPNRQPVAGCPRDVGLAVVGLDENRCKHGTF
jgi:catechol 2,3-dioxygenase-like lactoylglutathione lyase family enzyme